MSELRTLLWRALLDAGMLIDDTRFDRVRLEAAAASRQHLRRAVHGICGQEPAVVADSLGLSAGAIMRVFGHGWQQAAGFAALAEVRASRAGAISRLGALLSLGIVLFDHVLDTFAERRAVLMEQLTPELFLASPTATPARCGDTGIDFLVALAVEVVAGAQRLGGLPKTANGSRGCWTRCTAVSGRAWRHGGSAGRPRRRYGRRCAARAPCPRPRSPCSRCWAIRRQATRPGTS